MQGLLEGGLKADPAARASPSDLLKKYEIVSCAEAAARRVLGVADGAPMAADALRHACDMMIGTYLLKPHLVRHR